MNEAAQAIAGIHAPNSRFEDFRWEPDEGPAGRHAVWSTICEGGFGWIKLLWPDHTRGQAALAKEFGLKVIIRAPGEGRVHHIAVAHIIREFAGVCDVIEIGNEPPLQDLWHHRLYLRWVWESCNQDAKAAGIKLCTPGWFNKAIHNCLSCAG